MTQVSVITAVRAQSAADMEWLSECISSVQAQRGLVFEHIVVDDGSPIDVADRYEVLRTQRLETPLRFLRTTGVGVAAARNIGVRAAYGDVFVVIDGDDYLTDAYCLKHIYPHVCDYQYAYGEIRTFDANGILNDGYPVSGEFSLGALRSSQNGIGTVGVTAMQTRALWARLGGWDEALPALEDIEYWIRAAEIGACGYYLQSPMLYYRKHPESRTATAIQSGAYRDAWRTIQNKHRQFFGGSMGRCSKCPDGTAVRQGNLFQKDGTMAQVKYVGRRSGAYWLPPSPNGNRYRVSGSGGWINVHEDDVAWVLEVYEGNEPCFQLGGHAGLFPHSAPDGAKPKALPLVTLAIDITTISAKQCLEEIGTTSSVDILSMWLAQERSALKPRKTILSTLEQAIRERGGGA